MGVRVGVACNYKVAGKKQHTHTQRDTETQTETETERASREAKSPWICPFFQVAFRERNVREVSK